MKLNRAKIISQIKANIVAIASIIVALTGMGYNTWRNEKTEINHNVRAAAFETLKNLGEAQTIIEYAHFKKDRTLRTPSACGRRGGTMSKGWAPVTRP